MTYALLHARDHFYYPDNLIPTEARLFGSWAEANAFRKTVFNAHNWLIKEYTA